MGRPPIGKVAMTPAERVARYRLKHGIVTKQEGSDHSVLAQELVQAKRELAAARARIAELEGGDIDSPVLSMTAQQKLDAAIHQRIRKLDKSFEQQINEEVRRRIDAADNEAREQNKQLRRENMDFQRIVSQRGVFTKAQFRQMQMLCHPDSSASERTKAELSRILVENEKRLVKPEHKPEQRGKK